MNTKQKVLLTQEGLEELKKEHQQLKEIKRPRVVERLTESRDMGDLTESSEYTAARQDLAFIDKRISELEEILKNAKVVKSSQRGKKKVAIGTKVTLKDGDKKALFTVVGDWEADPLKNKISPSSPIGKALMGKKAGDKVEVKIPAGKVEYKILKIE